MRLVELKLRGEENMELREAIATVVSGQSLSENQAREIMGKIMSGQATQAQIGALLTALRMKKESVEEIAGFAQGMRAAATQVAVPELDLVDTCGTGGDGAGTFNISTTAAFVVAGAGLKVAKHGNRFASSRCGSADVLEALGVNISITPEEVAQCIRVVGIGFLFAQIHHTAMRHAIGPRREIGVRTAFNLLGPLTNPAGARYQLVGVFDPNLTELLASALQRLGCSRALVVNGEDGLDELTITGTSQVTELKGGEISTFQFDPREYGFELADIQSLAGDDAASNARITRAVLAGELGPQRNVVLLNAGAAIYVCGGADNLEDAFEKAKASIDSGAALKCLEELIHLSNSLGGNDNDIKQNCAS
jgi:anthranilate phosphoribosyltransferase